MRRICFKGLLKTNQMLVLFIIGILLITANYGAATSLPVKDHSIQVSQRTQNEEFIFLEEDLLYLLYTNHIAIYNVSNPKIPKLITLFETAFENIPANFHVDNRIVYVSDFEKNLYIIDCSDLLNIFQRPTIVFDYYLLDIKVKDSLLFIAHQNNLTIYDLSDWMPKVISTLFIPCGQLSYLAIYKNAVFAFEFQADFTIVNITNINNPQIYSRSEEYWSRKISHCGNILLTMTWNDNFRILNISNPFSPQFIEEVIKRVYSPSLEFVYYSNQLYFALYRDRLLIYNTTSSGSISYLTTLHLEHYKDGYLITFIVKENFVYIENIGNRGPLFVIDISNPANPLHVFPRLSPIIPDYIIAIIVPILPMLGFVIVIIILSILIKKDKSNSHEKIVEVPGTKE